VDFGKGTGRLAAAVVSSLPTNLFAPPGSFSSLTSLSNVNILTTSGSTGSGNTQVTFLAAGVGSSANLQIKDLGGKGADVLAVLLGGTQDIGSTVGVTFFGNDGNDLALILDFESIQVGATATFDLHGQKGNDQIGVLYQGQLNGTLKVNADGGPDNDLIDVEFNLLSGSNFGSLTSSVNGGPGNDRVTDLVHKLAADTTTVDEKADGGPGFNRGTFTQTTATSVAVNFTNFQVVNFVP
jgi:hypothetical protein